MTEAVRASIIVLLFIAAIAIIVAVVRSGGKSGSVFKLDSTKTNSTMAATETSVDGDAAVRRRFLEFMGIAGVGLGALFVKLWSMQVISGRDYTAKAEENRITEYTTVAPRGRIFDRNGVELVGNRASFAVLISADEQSNKKVIRRLSNVLGIPRETVAAKAIDSSGGAQADRLIALDVDERAISYIAERPLAFPGVTVESRTVRTYPQGTLAAHVLGYAGTISQEELSQQGGSHSYESGDSVGKDGAEQAFESYLQGDRGVKRVEINAAGDVVGTVDSIDPVRGNDVCLTIDSKVQEVAEEALQQAFRDAAAAKYDNAAAGAIVCLDATNGEVIAMASAPTYDPSQFVGGVSSDVWDTLVDPDNEYPLSNRCIAGLYPAASTFKGFTGLAGLEHKFASTTKTWNCKGTWTGFGKSWPQKCWNLNGHGHIGFHHGIVESCDVVFYEIGKQFYNIKGSDTVLQEYLQDWGFGSLTGIELSGEQEGRVPTPEWKKEYNKDAPESQAWQPGDITNLIIGQGDLLVTPLQIACGYAGLATGSIPKPVLLKSVLAQDGKTTVVDGSRFYGSNFNPSYKKKNLAIMRSGFEGVVSEGSVKSVFAGMGVKSAGKTGTGEVAGKDNYAWYVGYAPAKNPKYVCACIIEQGGAGATSAAPAVRSVLAKALGKSSKHVSGHSTHER